MSRPLRHVGLAGAACMLVLGITATTASAMTLSLGAPTLSNRILISVPATVSCDPFDASLTYFAYGVTVSVQQAAGREIARGTGAAGSFMDGLIPCDSAPHTVDVNVSADPAGPPFHGGPASFSASAYADAGYCYGPNGSWGCALLAWQSASTGSTTLNLN